MIRRLLPLLTGLVLALAATAAPETAHAVSCGGQSDNCQCGKNNPYPCCDNNGNCTWWAWHSACCGWGVGLPGWGNANTWASYASQNGNFEVLNYPVPNSIATSTKGGYGHVAWVTAVNGSKITVTEQNCCGSCKGGARTWSYDASYFNSGYVIRKGQLGPVCGNGKCENNENCSNCSQDCGSCCGNGACDNGENCGSCSKDCGSCCGNGQCDNGENCSTCDKDCGKCCGNGACDYGEQCETCPTDCKCLPSGELSPTCAQAAGWAWDPDNQGEKVHLAVQVDGAEMAKFVAEGPYPNHDGRGFAWPVPAELKDGQPHAVTAVVADTQTAGTTTLGPKSFLCENSVGQLGIWTVTRTDSAGMSVLLPEVDPPNLALRNEHPAGYPYPISGTVDTCTQPGVQPFDAVEALAEWDLAGAPFVAKVLIDGKEAKAWQGPAGSEPFAFVGKGTQICIRTEAMAMVDAPAAAMAVLRSLRMQRGPWWYSYRYDTEGLTFSRPGADEVVFLPRSPAGGAAQGWARAWHDFSQAFDAVSYQLHLGPAPVPGGVAELLIDGKPYVATEGGRVQAVTPGKQLAVQLRLEQPTTLDPTAAVAFSQVRVHQNDVQTDGPWTIAKKNSWGFSGGISPDVDLLARGLDVTLRHDSPGWWTTGAVEALLEVKGAPFERVRGQVRTVLPHPSLQVQVIANGEVAHTVQGQSDLQAFDVPAIGNWLAVRLGVSQDREMSEAAEAQVRNVEWLRQGWWSAYSPRAAGFRDDRPAPGAVRFEHSRAWAMLDHAPQGAVVVHREFVQPQTGVRFTYSYDLPQGLYRVFVLLDGKPARLLDDMGADEVEVELTGESFTDLGLAFVAREDAPIVAEHGFAEATQIAVQGKTGKWTPFKDAAVIAPMMPNDAGTLDIADIASDATATAAQPSDPGGGGCTATPQSTPATGGLLMLVLLGLWGLARRRIGRA
jgi:MYXO-CTERM domain-containing protein